MKHARTIREQKGLSIYDVSKAIGIIPTTLARFETDITRTLRWPWLGRLAAYYGVTEADLMRPADAPAAEVPA